MKIAAKYHCLILEVKAMKIEELASLDLVIPPEIEKVAKSWIRGVRERKQKFFSTFTFYAHDELIFRVFAVLDKGENKERKIHEIIRRTKDHIIGRNLWFSQMAGWRCVFPGEKYNHYYYYYGQCEFDEFAWENAPEVKNIIGEIVDSETRDVEAYLGCKYPYILKKYKDVRNLDPNDLFRLLGQYEKSTSIESLLQLGMIKVANDKRLLKLTKEKKSQILHLIKQTNDERVLKNITLSQIFRAIKIKCSLVQIFLFDYLGARDFKELRYFVKHGMDKSDDNKGLYDDYLRMAAKAGHNIEDDYWRYPNDIQKAHDKVMLELKFIDEFDNQVKYNDSLEMLYGKLAKKNHFENDKYKIFIPTKVKDIQKQCDVLYQCLIRSDYIQMMIDKQFLLFFIWTKDNKPVATAQVFWDKKIGQFYGDERDRNNCKPTEEIETLFNDYLKNVSLKKPTKIIPKMHYFKGFAEGFKSIYGDQYEVGQVYDTNVADNQFNLSCKSSNKAIHFCRNITSVNKFIPNAKYYAEVEPLGPVLNVGEEYFSNRIKIVRIVPNPAYAMD